MNATFELVLPARFAEFVSGCDLLETRDADRDPEYGTAVLGAWAKATTRRGQTVVTVDMDEDGRKVTGFFFDYADQVALAGAEDFTAGERRAARLVVDRIVAIRKAYRKVVQARESA